MTIINVIALLTGDRYQVIVGFMLSAYLTLILVILHYISNPQCRNNFIDHRFISLIKPKVWKEMNSTDSETWAQAIRTSVLMFSDTQLITGMAIMLCGYTQLASGIDSYHWEVVICLAWFSSLTHLATLSSLRDHFRNRPFMASCRAGLMGVVLIMLAVSFGTTGYLSQPNWGHLQQPSWLAKCLFSFAEMSGEPYNKAFIVFSVIFLLVSYLTRVVSIFNPTAGVAKKWLKTIPRDWMRRGYISRARKAEQDLGTWINLFWKVATFLQALAYIICKALFDIAESMLWEVYCSSFTSGSCTLAQLTCR